jgi:ankyrin repeat protein
MLFEPRPGVNALTAACEEGDVASVSTLLGRGAPVTAMTAEGMPPLALAARYATSGPLLYDDDDDNVPVWATWAVGVLSGVRGVFTSIADTRH